MTASTANGFGHILLPAELDHLPHEAVRVPPGVLDGESARQHVVDRTRTTSRCPTRSVISRTAADRRERQLRDARGARTPMPRQDDGNNFCVPGSGLDAGNDQRVLLRRRGLGWSVLPSGLAGDEPEPVRRPAAASDADAVHQRDNATTGRSTTRRSRSRRTFRASRQKTRSSTRRSVIDQTGANCVNPPNGAQFYPFFTTFGWRS